MKPCRILIAILGVAAALFLTAHMLKAAPPTYTPIVTSSCDPCDFPEEILSIGSGFKPHQKVKVYARTGTIQGESIIEVKADASGNWSLWWGRGLYIAQPGVWTFEATTMSGTSLAVSAPFTVNPCPVSGCY